ncbi:MAG: outer membrane lipoprotein-sorting protein [Candidatus Aminicenantes bacterium]|nr:outer membrane lipoprotein-sorting protein [Candidatus Aminicenantes bacterium]MDH5705787.1 outer membrane lipoprotein-sorting protein [Candidatus Aminicenantes bacterium]
MKRVLSLTIAGLFLTALLSAPGSAQTAEQVLKKMVEAQGGQKLFESIKDITLTGSVEIPMQGLSGTLTMYKKEPDKRRLDFEVMGMVITQAYDGQIGWYTNPQTGSIEEMGEELLAETKRQALPIVAIIYPGKYGMTYAYQGKETIEGQDYFLLEETYPDGFKATLYIDAGTYLIYKQKVKVMQMGAEVEVEQFSSDYKKFNGMMIAQSIVSYAGGEEAQRISINEVKFNTGLDDALFKKD